MMTKLTLKSFTVVSGSFLFYFSLMIISMLLSCCRRATLWLQPNQDRGSTTVRSWQTRVQRKSAPTSSERSSWSICPRKCPIQWHRWQVNHFCTLRCRLTDYESLAYLKPLILTFTLHADTCFDAAIGPCLHPLHLCFSFASWGGGAFCLCHFPSWLHFHCSLCVINHVGLYLLLL